MKLSFFEISAGFLENLLKLSLFIFLLQFSQLYHLKDKKYVVVGAKRHRVTTNG